MIQPQQPVEIARVEKNKEKLEELYQIGYEDAKRLHGKLMEFLN